MAKRDREPKQGVRRYDVPFGVQGLPLANPELGIGRLLTRSEPYSYRATVTVLDAPDHRLVRAGVLLAHRILDGVGEWYLAAPAWTPLLPAEEIVPLGSDDLPERFADLIAPFRRRATLAPMAALTYKRVEYVVTGTDDRQLALLRDERATIRRGGLTTGRFRQCQVTPLEADADQLAAIDEALAVVGAVRVKEFPSLAQRLGTPATGLSDFPPRRSWSTDESLESFVRALLGARLRDLIAADLAVRTQPDQPRDELHATLAALEADLRGLRPFLQAAWVNEVLADIEWVRTRPVDTPAAVLLGERYLAIVDRLVRAARAPRLGSLSLRPAGSALGQQAQLACLAAVEAASSIHPYSPDEDWEALVQRLDAAGAVVGLAAHVLGKPVRKQAKRLDRLVRRAEAAAAVPVAPAPGTLVDLGPVDAFAAGRAYERELAAQAEARREFCEGWPKARRSFRRAGVKA